MGKTIAQKIIASHLVSGDMTPGSEVALRIDQTLLDKLGYIAEYEGRTKNRELEQMIKIQFCFGCTNSRRRIAPQRGFVIS